MLLLDSRLLRRVIPLGDRRVEQSREEAGTETVEGLHRDGPHVLHEQGTESPEVQDHDHVGRHLVEDVIHDLGQDVLRHFTVNRQGQLGAKRRATHGHDAHGLVLRLACVQLGAGDPGGEARNVLVDNNRERGEEGVETRLVDRSLILTRRAHLQRDLAEGEAALGRTNTGVEHPGSFRFSSLIRGEYANGSHR